MLCQGCGREASPSGVQTQFLGETVASKMEENTGTIINKCLIKLLAVPDTTDLVVIVELT
jgi:hypothetical protein